MVIAINGHVVACSSFTIEISRHKQASDAIFVFYSLLIHPVFCGFRPLLAFIIF